MLQGFPQILYNIKLCLLLWLGFLKRMRLLFLLFYFTIPNFFDGASLNSIRPLVAFEREIVGDDIFSLNGVYWGKYLTMTVTDRRYVSDLL